MTSFLYVFMNRRWNHIFFFFSSRRRHTRFSRDWSSDVCSSDLPYLLRGLVSCGVCRLACTGVTRTATDTRYRYYRCLGKQARVSSGRASCCPARFIPATQLDELVWADLCEVLQQP